MEVADVDLTDPDAFVEGRHHEMLATLRAEDPVHWHRERDGGGFWCLTKHADVQLANRDPDLFSSAVQGVNILDLDDDPRAGTDGVREMMIMMDPPRHTRYRLLVNKGFTPRMIGKLEEFLAARATQIVDDVVASGSCDFVTDISAELPLQAIAELMGVPQDDRHCIFEWSNHMVGSDDPEFGEADGAEEAAAGLFLYASALRDDKRRCPADDIVSRLIGAEVDGHGLTDTEFSMFFLLLAVAGNETTRNATNHGMRALIEHADQYALLRDRTDELLATAVEEILRWSTPVLYFRRTATRDVELRGKTIRAGDKVVMWHASANRDEEVFADPFRFDVTRTPNDHVSFGGGGAHFCLGANLARMELALIFRELVTRIPDMELAGPVEVLRSNFIGGIKHMPVRFTPSG
jgi:cholest-4-en-3-one 26-monooxygenase